MIFGDHVRAPASSSTAEPVVAACRGAFWTVGWLVPDGHARCVRIGAPAPDIEDWWGAYRSLFRVVAAVGAAHTSTPGRAWFGIWEGHGWENWTTSWAFAEPEGDAELGRGPGAASGLERCGGRVRWEPRCRSDERRVGEEGIRKSSYR